MNKFNFTSQEKKAIICALGGIMGADGKHEKKEMDYLFGVGTTLLGLPLNEVPDALKMGAYVWIQILSEMTTEAKKEVAGMMIGMIMADDFPHDKEIEIFLFICRMAGIPIPNHAYERLKNLKPYRP